MCCQGSQPQGKSGATVGIFWLERALLPALHGQQPQANSRTVDPNHKLGIPVCQNVELRWPRVLQGSEALPAPPPARKPSERPAEALKPVQAEARNASQAPTALHFTKKVTGLHACLPGPQRAWL